MLYLGISRENRFSPNRIISDKAIFDDVCKNIATDDDLLFKMSEEEFSCDGAENPSLIDAVFHMCRSDRSLKRLKEMEGMGVTVVNSAQGVINCRRAEEVRLLQGTGASFVKSRIVTAADDVPEDWTGFPCWVKRGDSHAMKMDDVCYAADRAECAAVLKDMAERGFAEAVLQEHAQGKICKFYGIGQGLFFQYSFLDNVGSGKFGLEKYNEIGKADVDEARFRHDVAEIAGILGVDVYGGDAVVGPDGHAVIVDFNDWPSFFVCHKEAAPVISELIRSKAAR